MEMKETYVNIAPVILQKTKKKRNQTTVKAYALLSPALLVILLVFFYPIIQIVIYSFSSIKGATSTFVGFRNYQYLFDNPSFIEAIKNNGKMLLAVPILIVLSVIISILLFERLRGWKFYRSILFFPYILAIPVVGIVFSYIFQLNGVLNEFLRKIGLEAFALDWIGSSKLALPSLMAAIIWKELGFGIVLFLARLLSIPAELYEAARLDGAGWWKMHWHITMPELRNIVEFYFVITIITMISWVFGYVYVMTNGGPGNSTMVSELFIYQTAFRNNNIGMASAVSVILLAVSFIFVFLQLGLRKGEEDAFSK
jgi:ABC-type sugar transport system permease subunit